MAGFLDALHSGRVLLMDGAMGTELQRAGLRDGECGELWNLTQPDDVRAIHQAYVDAGAAVLLTNTFQSNPHSLARFGVQDKLEVINQAAIELCRSVAGPDRFVIGDIGPIGEPHLVRDLKRVTQSLRGVDAILLETASDLVDLAALFLIWEREPDMWKMPVLFSMTCQRKGEAGLVLPNGFPISRLAMRAYQNYDLAALGFNCGQEIQMEELAILVTMPCVRRSCFVRPNAGTPTKLKSRWQYPHTPTAMAEKLPMLLKRGVRMIGGCCGTTPEHIAAFRPIVEAWNAQH